MPTKVLDKMFPKLESGILTREQFEKLSAKDKLKYKKSGETFIQKKSNK